MGNVARGSAVLVVAALVAACGGSSSGGVKTSSGSIAGTVHVFAAASLTEALTTLGKQFEAAHPGVKVVFNFAASSALAQQINQGAPADVFASASGKNMDQVVSAGGASNPTPFVKNIMEVAVPPSNPAHIASVTDLARKDVKVALCQSQVPCGATAAKVFTNAKISLKPVTEEADVKSVLTKVELGEVDAGVVYVTDVRAAGTKVKGIAIPASIDASTTYPIAALRKASNTTAAQGFVAYVLSSAGSAVLSADGYEKP
jgi:molybdate transport system substrate-binding protein